VLCFRPLRYLALYSGRDDIDYASNFDAVWEILAAAHLIFICSVIGGMSGLWILLQILEKVKLWQRQSAPENRDDSIQRSSGKLPLSSFLRKILLSSTVLAITYTAVEFTLSGLWLNGYIGAQTYWIREDTGQGPMFQFDSARGFRLSSYSSRWACMATDGTVQAIGRLQGNSQGFPDRDDFGPHRPHLGIRRVAVFGDSFTAGQYLEQNWPDKVEDLRPDDQLELLNFSIDGGGLANWYSILENVVNAEAYDIDGVVFAVYGEDLRRTFFFSDDQMSYECESHGHLLAGYNSSFPRRLEQCLAFSSANQLDKRSFMWAEYVLPAAGFERALRGEWQPTHLKFKPYVLHRLWSQLAV
jgi:hypothetical protein